MKYKKTSVHNLLNVVQLDKLVKKYADADHDTKSFYIALYLRSIARDVMRRDIAIFEGRRFYMDDFYKNWMNQDGALLMFHAFEVRA